jgi:hypothetical protein
MSDFETKLAEALTSGAEEAPVVDRLADGARTRAKARRRTRTALVAVGTVAALAVPVSVIAITADGEGDAKPDHSGLSTQPSDEKPRGDRNSLLPIENDGVQVNVPGNWVKLDTSSCEFRWIRFAPYGVDPCDYDGASLSFYASATFDPATSAGEITSVPDSPDRLAGGYVYAGDWAVYVQAGSVLPVTEILSSVRTNDYDWPTYGLFPPHTVKYDGLAIDVPIDWREGALSNWCRDKSVSGWVERPGTVTHLSNCSPYRTGYGVRFGASEGEDSAIEERGGPKYPAHSWAGIAVAPDANGEPAGFVEIVAPTEGLAQVIGASLRLDK